MFYKITIKNMGSISDLNKGKGADVLHLPIKTLMHATIESGNIFFNNPFESPKEVQDFQIWLIRHGVMDTSIKDLDGNQLNQEQCVGKDSFIFSSEAIELCLTALRILNEDSRLVLSPGGAEEQVSLILSMKKTA